MSEPIAEKKVTRFRFVDVVFASEQTKEKSMFNVKIFSVTSNRTNFGRRLLIFKMTAHVKSCDLRAVFSDKAVKKVFKFSTIPLQRVIPTSRVTSCKLEENFLVTQPLG